MSEEIKVCLILMLCGVLFGGEPDLVDAIAQWINGVTQ
jgi:hypothetical protein